MDFMLSAGLNNTINLCSICDSEIKAGEEYEHNSKVLCEECCIDIRTPRVRKTHWQYLRSIKTGYLVPGNST